MTLGEAHDEVHCDLCERGGIFGDSDLVKGGAGFMREVLVLLAHSAPFHVLFYPGSRSWPEIMAVDLSCHVISPSMPPSFVFVPHP